VIDAGADGFSAPTASVAFVVAAVGLALFAAVQVRGRHPMVPREVLRSRTVLIASGTGFAFLAGLTGTVFVYSLYLQQHRGLSSFTTGLVFLPMTALSAFLGVPTAWLAERFGARVPVVGGLVLMGTSLTVLAALPAAVPGWLLAVVLIPVGICGPLAMQPTTAVLLDSVPLRHSGVAGGVFNTSRQVGGALAVAVFGALLANQASVLAGLRESMLIAAALVFMAAVANLLSSAAVRVSGESP
jgi:MFS family permease